MESIARMRRRILGGGLVPALLGGVPITYETAVPPDGHGELDTPAVYVAADASRTMLFVTDKTWDYLEVHDPVLNTYLGRIGGSGSGPGQLDRPNAVAVGYGIPTTAGPLDFLFVVERGNHRVSMYVLPWGIYVGAFGAAELQEPMGLALHVEAGQPQAWITDIGPSPQRVVVFDLVPVPTGLAGVQRLSFPVPPTAILESIAVDPASRRALVCDEGAWDVMVYDLEGHLLGRFGAGRFTDDPEGLAIYDTGNGTGYVIVTDQNAQPVQWEVFDRQDYRFLLQFTGATAGTDGIDLVQRPLPNFPQGSFFAVHLDRAVHAYSWADIAAATGLCIGMPCAPVDAGDGATQVAGRSLSIPSPLGAGGTLAYRLDAPAEVQIDLHDVRGTLLARLLHDRRPAGRHALAWDGRDRRGAPLPAGVYLLRARFGDRIESRKIAVVH